MAMGEHEGLVVIQSSDFGVRQECMNCAAPMIGSVADGN